jgi:small conductance mechanosensitive channel
MNEISNTLTHVNGWKDQLINLVVTYGGKVVAAYIAFFIGKKVLKKIMELAFTKMDGKLDKDLQPFLLSMLGAVLNLALFLVVASIVGIETTQFIAIFGGAMFAVGLALQGSLSNFAGGVLILIFKPFRTGDIIEVNKIAGRVEGIQILNTMVLCSDGKTVILPNGDLATSSVINYSLKDAVKVSLVFATSCQQDIEEVRSKLQKIVNACPFALKEQKNYVLISKVTDNSIFFDIQIWTKPHTFWETYYSVNEEMAEQFGKQGTNPIVYSPKTKDYIPSPVFP